MTHDAIDSVFLAVSDLDAACRPYERLGLKLSPARDGRRTLHVGGPASLFAVHFLADAALVPPLRNAAARPLLAVALRVADLDAALAPLAAKGVPAERLRDGEADLAWLPLHVLAGTDLVLVKHAQTVQDRHADAVRAGLLDHSFRLKRLDHLAAV